MSQNCLCWIDKFDFEKMLSYRKGLLQVCVIHLHHLCLVCQNQSVAFTDETILNIGNSSTNIPMSSGRASMQFSEAWRSERRERRDRRSGKCSSLFLVTSSTARLSSWLVDWMRRGGGGRDWVTNIAHLVSSNASNTLYCFECSCTTHSQGEQLGHVL